LLVGGGAEIAVGTGILKTSPHCLQRDFLPASAPSISYRFPQPGQSSTINIDGSPVLPQKRGERELLFHGLTCVNGDSTFPVCNRKPVANKHQVRAAWHEHHSRRMSFARSARRGCTYSAARFFDWHNESGGKIGKRQIGILATAQIPGWPASFSWWGLRDVSRSAGAVVDQISRGGSQNSRLAS
jgi:hypothetical protein